MILVALLALAVGCGARTGVLDEEVDDPRVDAGRVPARDAGRGIDAGRPRDAGDPPLLDAGPPVDAGPPGPAPTALAAGHYHSCAIRDGIVHCWGGISADVALGDGSSEGSARPVRVLGIEDATAVAIGGSHNCVLRRTGAIACWGRNESSQLGRGPGSIFFDPLPEPVADIDDAIAISLGERHSCALRATGGLYCWGNNEANQAVQPSLGPQIIGPTPVAFLPPTVAFAAGPVATCAIDAAQAVRCWGESGTYSFGRDLDNAYVWPPADATDLTPAVAVVGTGWPQPGAGMCVIRPDRTVRCCPRVRGVGILPSCLDITELGPVVDLASRGVSTCAVRADARVACWGYQHSVIISPTPSGELTNTPIVHEAIAGASSVAVGQDHACAIVGRDVVCWGSNEHGQLGNGRAFGASRAPQVVLF